MKNTIELQNFLYSLERTFNLIGFTPEQAEGLVSQLTKICNLFEDQNELIEKYSKRTNELIVCGQLLSAFVEANGLNDKLKTFTVEYAENKLKEMNGGTN